MLWSIRVGPGTSSATVIFAANRVKNLHTELLIKLFRYRCYGCGATSEYLFKIGDFAPTGAG